jgi:hypothetical protein
MATLAEVLRQAGYVTPQGQVVGPRTTTAQTMSNYIRNIIPNAAQNLAQQRSDIDAALTMGDQGIQVGDRAAFERQMAQVPNLMGLTAYHGTPHTIKGKFDISKVGTGEGAQAYGHGMYFAENPKVAEAYRTGGIGAKTEFVSKNPEHDKALFILRNKPMSDTDIMDLMVNDFKFDPQKAKAGLQEAKQTMNQSSNLYKVDIPDEYIPNMLDWDKPISQQSDLVKNALLNHPEVQKYLAEGEAKRIAMNKAQPARLEKLPQIANKVFDENRVSGQQVVDRLNQVIGDPKKVSEMLNELGITGIRYLDEGSRARGKGTSNFVVFEPSEVKILEQNSKPMTRKEIIEQELEKVSK